MRACFTWLPRCAGLSVPVILADSAQACSSCTKLDEEPEVTPGPASPELLFAEEIRPARGEAMPSPEFRERGWT